MTSRIEQYNTKLAHLETERSRWEPTLKDIAEQMAPYRTIWDVTNTGQGEKRDNKNKNDTPIQAAKTQEAGLLAGLTPSNKHWFQIGPSDPELSEHPQVKRYFEACRTRIERQLASDGLYAALSNGGYLDLGVFGQAGIIFEDGPAEEMRGSGGARHALPTQVIQAMPVGEYYLDVNALGQVDTFYRKRQLNVRQAVRKFGYDACSPQVRNAWDRGNYYQAVVVVHAVQPNDELIDGRPGRFGMRFASCWWEYGDNGRKQFLREAGYTRLPGLFPRWETLIGDAYGRGPGWYQRATSRQLQFYEDTDTKITDKINDPALVVEEGVLRASLIPGEVTFVPKGSTIRASPVYVPPPGALDATERKIERLEFRIERGFNVDLWRRLIDDQRNERPTAEEVVATREEKALLQGPLLENANVGLLRPLVEGTYERMAMHGALPLPGDPDGPPPELEGADVKAEFISPMHILQQSIGIGGLRTFSQEVGAVAQLWPEALDRIDIDVMVDEYARSTGMRPDITRPKEEAEAMRQARAQQEQAKQATEALQQGAGAFKDLASANPDNLAKLGSVAQQFPAPVAGGSAPAAP